MLSDKFYLTSNKQCNNIRFGMPGEMSFYDLTGPLTPAKDANCNGFTISAGTKLSKFQSKIGTEQACLINLQTDGTQKNAATYKVYARTSDKINAYVSD